jgi:hypothetical protein
MSFITTQIALVVGAEKQMGIHDVPFSRDCSNAPYWSYNYSK